jgi:hypothetical protein
MRLHEPGAQRPKFRGPSGWRRPGSPRPAPEEPEPTATDAKADAWMARLAAMRKDK